MRAKDRFELAVPIAIDSSPLSTCASSAYPRGRPGHVNDHQQSRARGGQPCEDGRLLRSPDGGTFYSEQFTERHPDRFELLLITHDADISTQGAARCQFAGRLIKM